MTADNVTQILNKIQGNERWDVMSGVVGLDIPRSVLEEIERRYSTDTEKNHAYADYYVNFHSNASWENLTRRLYNVRELTLARESKSFMSTGKFCHKYYTICIY